MEIGEIVWTIVMKWEYFERKILGVQLVVQKDMEDSIIKRIKIVITVADPQKKLLQESGRPRPGTLCLMKNLSCLMKNLIFISD